MTCLTYTYVGKGAPRWSAAPLVVVMLAIGSGCEGSNFEDDERGDAGSPRSDTGMDADSPGGDGAVSARSDGGDADRIRSPDGPGADDGAGGADEASAGDTAGSKSWTSYGFDLSNTQYNPEETVLNADNLAQLSERWRVNLPFGASSTPIVYDGTVYFGGWDGNAYAVDAQTGEIRWQRQVTTMLVRSTPVVSEDRVYLAAGPNLVALDRRDGSPAFETLLDAHPETLIDGSPKLVDGLVVVGVSSVENSLVKEYTFTGAVVAIDAASGEELWRFKTTGDDAGPCPGGAGAAVWSTPAVDQELGLLYVGSGQNYEEPVSPCSDALLAIHYRRDHQGERLAWKAQYTPDDIWAREPLTSLLGADADVATPALFEVEGKPVVGAADKKGRYRVYERATGKPVWERELDHGDQTVFFPPSAFHDGTLYMVSNHVDIISDPSNPMTSTLYALDAQTGRSLWEVKLPTIQVGAVAIANDVLYHATVMDGVLYARDLATGEQRWSTTLNGGIAVGPSIVNGHIYVSLTLPGEDEGFGQTTALPAGGGVVLSLGLGQGPSMSWAAEVQEPKTFTKEECQTAVENVSDWPSGGTPSPECAACLCACNANAAAQCDTCWLQAPCVVLSCAFSAPEEMRSCVGNNCQAKLITNFTFERSVEVAPCAVDCALTCGFL